MKPLMMRTQADFTRDGGALNLIGLELLLQHPNGRQEEVQMIALDIELEGMHPEMGTWWFGPLTLHTSGGDINIPQVPIQRGSY